MFEFFTENELISSNQSDLKPGDSCISRYVLLTKKTGNINYDILN